MTVDTIMMPNNRQMLPAISQHRSITFLDNSTPRSHSNRQGGATVKTVPDGGAFCMSRTESSGQSSSRSDSSVSESARDRSRQSSSQFNMGVQTQTVNTIHLTQSLNLLPRLLDDYSLMRAARNTAKEHSALSSRSLEVLPSRDFISDEIRMRTVSLPNLRTRRKHRLLIDGCEDEDLSDSYPSDNDDPSDDDSNIVGIYPYPNVGVDSYLDSHLLPEFLPPYLKPWTPGIRKNKPKKNHKNAEAEKKRKEMEALQAKLRKRSSQAKSNNPRRRSVRSNAFARKREHEVAKRYPVRKQFVYSELVQDEFQKHIPTRLPGGKLKPIYDRRTTEGEIYVPDQIDISFEKLSVKSGDQRINLFDTPAAINRRRKEELQAQLEKRKKIQRQMVNKNKRKVRFVLPEENRLNEVRSKVVAEGKVQIGSGRLDSEDEEGDITTENGKSMENDCGHASEQIDNRSLSDVIDGDILDEGNELRIKRTNSWVSHHLANESIESVTGTEVNHNSAQTQEDVVIANSSMDVLPNRNISKDSSEDNSSISKPNPSHVDVVPPETQELVEITNNFISNDDGVKQATLGESPSDAQPGKHLNIGLSSPLRTVAEPTLIESVVVTKDVKFLSERIPSIIISDT